MRRAPHLAVAGVLLIVALAAGTAGWLLIPDAGSDAATTAPAPAAAPATVPATPADPSGAAGPTADPAWVARTARATGIGERALSAYAAAALRVAEESPRCGLSWNTLAGIGQVESEHGTIDGSRLDADGTADPPIVGIALDGRDGVRAIADTDGGRLDGDTEWDRAVGPMQFIPRTWERFADDADADGASSPDVQNIDDAALAAARYLCSAGVDLREPDGWLAAVRSYNDDVDYARQVAAWATQWS